MTQRIGEDWAAVCSYCRYGLGNAGDDAEGTSEVGGELDDDEVDGEGESNAQHETGHNRK